MKVAILPSAREDLAAGHGFYERQAQGLGTYFLDSLIADIDSLAVHGGIHRRVFGAHRMLARTFPFAVYYELVADEARVKAVLDCRRDPAWVRRKLRKADWFPKRKDGDARRLNRLHSGSAKAIHASPDFVLILPPSRAWRSRRQGGRTPGFSRRCTCRTRGISSFVAATRSRPPAVTTGPP